MVVVIIEAVAVSVAASLRRRNGRSSNRSGHNSARSRAGRALRTAVNAAAVHLMGTVDVRNLLRLRNSSGRSRSNRIGNNKVVSSLITNSDNHFQVYIVFFSRLW